MAFQLDKFFLALLANIRSHNKRFVEFHRKQKKFDKKDPYAAGGSQVSSGTESVAGVFSFGIASLSGDAIHAKFSREALGQAAAPAYSTEAKNPPGDLEVGNYLVQNELLASAEKTMLDATRGRLRNVIYTTAQRLGHSNGLGVTDMAKVMASRQPIEDKT